MGRNTRIASKNDKTKVISSFIPDYSPNRRNSFNMTAPIRRPMQYNTRNIDNSMKLEKNRSMHLPTRKQFQTQSSSQIIKKPSVFPFISKAKSKPYSSVDIKQQISGATFLKAYKLNSQTINDPLGIQGELIYDKEVTLQYTKMRVAMILKDQSILIRVNNPGLTKKFELEVPLHKGLNISGGELNCDLLASRLALKHGELILTNSGYGTMKTMQENENIKNISRYKRVMIGERDLVGGFLLDYNHTYAKIYRRTDDQQIHRNFEIYSRWRDQEIREYIEAHTQPGNEASDSELCSACINTGDNSSRRYSSCSSNMSMKDFNIEDIQGPLGSSNCSFLSYYDRSIVRH